MKIRKREVGLVLGMRAGVWLGFEYWLAHVVLVWHIRSRNWTEVRFWNKLRKIRNLKGQNFKKINTFKDQCGKLGKLYRGKV